MIYLKIDAGLSCEKLCRKIQKMLEKHPEAYGNILTISFKRVVYDDSNAIPKLEHNSK